MQASHSMNMLHALYKAAEVTKELNLTGLQIISLPPFPADLKKFIWAGSHQSPIETLPLLPKTLETLICSGSSIRELPNLPKKLKILDCSHTNLTDLPSLPSSLLHLNISQTQIRRIPPLPSTLMYLNCSLTPIQQLPELPETIQQLWCEDTKVCILPYLPRSLKFLATHMTPLLYIRTARQTMGQYRNIWNRHLQLHSEVRCQHRTVVLRQELIAKALHPDRVEKWLEQGGLPLMEAMLSTT